MRAADRVFYVPKSGKHSLYQYVRPVGNGCHVLQDVDTRQCYCWTLSEMAERFDTFRLKKVK